MMDGRVGAIRTALELHNHRNVQIMSYAANIPLLLRPFRDAVGSRGLLKGDTKSYQMDPPMPARRCARLPRHRGRRGQRDREARSARLDIVRRVKERFEIPVFAYQVSGEYAMIEAAVAAGAGSGGFGLETLTRSSGRLVRCADLLRAGRGNLLAR